MVGITRLGFVLCLALARTRPAACGEPSIRSRSLLVEKPCPLGSELFGRWRGGGLRGLLNRKKGKAKEEREDLSDAADSALEAELARGFAQPMDMSGTLDAPGARQAAAHSARAPLAGPTGAQPEAGSPALVAALLGAMQQSKGSPSPVDKPPAPSPAAAAAAEEDAIDDALGRALRRLRTSAGPAFPLALETICRILSNIIEQPDDGKFRRVRLNNPTISRRVHKLDGGFECLAACGFRQEGEVGDAAAFALPAERLDLPALRAAHARISSVRRRELETDRAAKSAVAELLRDLPPAVAAELESQPELRSAASAMVAHPLFGFMMADDEYRKRAQAAVRAPGGLRALLESFTTGRIESVRSREAWFDVLLDKRCVVALFSAKWCGPCQLLKPIVAHLSQMPSMQALTFVLVDADELPQVCQEAQVSAFPTVKLYVDCREQEAIVGGDVQKLVRVLETASKAGYLR